MLVVVTKNDQLVIRLTASQKKKLRWLADRKDKTMTDLVVEGLDLDLPPGAEPVWKSWLTDTPEGTFICIGDPDRRFHYAPLPPGAVRDV